MQKGKDRNSLAVDGGYLSRKLWFCFFSSCLILLSSLIVPGAALGEVITGLVTICGIFVTGSAVVRWKAGNIEQAKVTSKVKAPSEPEEKLENDMRG